MPWYFYLLLIVIMTALIGCSDSEDSDDDASESSSVTGKDATLTSLSASAGSLTPSFDPKVTSYTLAVPNGTTEVTMTATATDAKATIKVNDIAVPSGKASGPISVPEVGNTIDIAIRVTAARSESKTYSITIKQRSKPFAIYTIGDSTMANYAEDSDKRGWAQMFGQFLVGDDVTLVNAAVNGRSSKSFYAEGLWNGVKAKLKTGDYVFIQFGHNDEKDSGIEGTSGIGTAARGAYYDYLSKYVDESRALGATPILFTPVVRLGFSGSALSAKSCHDLTGNGTAEGDANYPASMRDVGAQKGCPVIDMTASTKALVEQYGPSDAKATIYVATDDTHLQPLGATVFAQLAAQELVEKKILADYLDPTTDVIINPSTLDFGDRYLSTSMDKSVTITGLSIIPESGKITVTAPQGFLVSATTDGPYTSSLDIPYSGGKLAPTKVYLRFQPEAQQSYSASVTVTSESDAVKTKEITVKGRGVAAQEGATESTAVYPLKSDGACTATGFMTCTEQTLSNLYVNGYVTPKSSTTETVWVPSAPSDTVMQKLTVLNPTTANEWPADPDSDPNRYIQFSVSATAGKTLTIDTISLYAGATGGKDMGFRIQYSTHVDFSDQVELANSTNNTSYTITFLTYSPMAEVNSGETFYLRIYPWYKKVATGKYLCLQNLTIHSVAR
jgi:lysophospholipase L1-like esterase